MRNNRLLWGGGGGGGDLDHHADSPIPKSRQYGGNKLSSRRSVPSGCSCLVTDI